MQGQQRERSDVQSSPAEFETVERVTLANFRNYRSLCLRLSSGFNVLAGENAQGKTNFLEALALASTTRLLRGQRDAEAILEGEDSAKVEIELHGTGTVVGVELRRGTRKRATLNGMGLPRAADLIGRLPSICLTTGDMEIVRGEPSDRRLMLDLELSGLYPSYLRHLTAYKRALDQRNALLRHEAAWTPPELFEPWENQLAEHGIPIRDARIEYIERLLDVARDVHSQMGRGEALTVTYGPKDEASDPGALLTALQASRAQDIHRGGTGVGPHRDDMLLTVGGRDARLYGSQGQQRTAVISLKLACLEVARQELGRPPLLLLDDILSDLDEHRRSLLVEAVLANAGQAILTCTEATAAGERILSQAAVFHVEAGEIRSA